jgi:hypothetical protein
MCAVVYLGTCFEYSHHDNSKLYYCRFNDPYILELDFEPFNVSVPRPNRSSSIGNGVQFLNRHLSSIMFRNRDCLEPLLDFLRGHRHKGHVCFAASTETARFGLVLCRVLILMAIPV